MMTFGIMSLDLNSEPSYINEMALLAESCGIECFRFSPAQIDPHSLRVNGKKFAAAAKIWTETEFQIPSIVYDRCFYGEDEYSKQCLPIVSWLKSRKDITFLGYGLPNKFELYQALQDSGLSAYLPQTITAANLDLVLKELAEKKKVILKPINGSQGHGIYFVKYSSKTIHVKTEKQKKIVSRIFPNEAMFIKWLQPLIKQHAYLLQPYLELTNSDLQPLDLRILLQKNEHGKWGERGRGIRIGKPGGILSNLSSGGNVMNFPDWAAALPKVQAKYIREELAFILRQLPHLLEKEFLPLFELGVDIGIAKNGSLWILDINSKPGRKVILQTRPEIKETLYLAPLLYGKYLSQMDQTERKNLYEKTLSH